MPEIAMYGKGGIGKSTISANMSAALAKSGKKILQVGCDPKHDSTRLLLHGACIATVLEYIKSTSSDKYSLSEIVHAGSFGVHCVEAGGPEPGVGCAGRGILTTFELLDRLGIKSNNYDAIIYDVLGDVVCGGFAVPFRSEYAEKVYIVTSGEFMSIYAANNILRGLKNYDADKPRAGGIILNSRGIGGEDERVRLFSEAAGLPILMNFPRSDLFTDSEKDGMCLVERFPDSEIAEQFHKLSELIFSQTELYPANPLTDEVLEEKVLGRKNIIPAHIGKPHISVNTVKKPMLYSKSLVSREPLHGCAFSGAMSICTQIDDAICVAHGPNSCAHITYQSITSLSRRFLLERGIVLPMQSAPPIVSSEMNEGVMIFGGMEELRNKVLAAKAKKPSVIFVLTTCPSGIIGDSLGFVREFADEETRIIPVLTDGNISGDYLQGILMAYMETARALIDKDVQPEENLVNIIAEKSIANATAESLEYIKEILSRLEIGINCRFICETSYEDIHNFKKAGLNILAYEDYMGRTLKSFLQDEFEAEFFDMPFPIGFGESCEWVRKMGVYFNKADDVSGIIYDYRLRYEKEINEIKPHLSGKRLMILTYNHSIDWILQTAVDLEMEISFVGIMDYSQENLFKTEYGDNILALQAPYNNENRRADLDRIKPDILLNNYSSVDLDGDYLTDTIPLCPTAGFMSGIFLAKRWSGLFRMNLKEGWKRDGELFRKYYA